jgi:hypothetical protein
MDLFSKISLVGLASAFLGASVYDWLKKRPEVRAERSARQAHQRATVDLVQSAKSRSSPFDARENTLLDSISMSALGELAFNAASEENRYASARALMRRKVGAERDSVLWSLINKHPDDGVRMEAARNMNSPYGHSPQAYVPLLDARSPEARLSAIDVLYSRPEYAQRVMKMFYAEPDPKLRLRILELCTFESGALQEIARKEESSDVRAKALSTLAGRNAAAEEAARRRADPRFGRCTRCGESDILKSEYRWTDDQFGEDHVAAIDPLCPRCARAAGY